MTATIRDQIRCVEREIVMRRRVYPKWVAAKRMSQAIADARDRDDGGSAGDAEARRRARRDDAMKKQHPICVVTIGIEHFVLPMDDGLKLVGIVSRAIPVKPSYQTYEHGLRWKLCDADMHRAQLAAIRPSDIETPEQVQGSASPCDRQQGSLPRSRVLALPKPNGRKS
ncbi:MAG TPA: hypothetical protein VGF92_02810 [Stellaceae bacterium]|jgi:hypothetical protein